MEKDKIQIVKEFIKIPKFFYSTVTDKPFSNCISCDKYLLSINTPYVIEKAVKQYQEYGTTDVIFEYAMCMDCYQNISGTMSIQSRKNIENYFSKHVNLNERRKKLLENDEINFNDWTSKCIIKDTPVDKLSEYQVVCQCDGTYMLYTNMPFLIGNVALDEMMQLLSNKTIGEINGFKDSFFSPDPDIQKILDEPKLILI